MKYERAPALARMGSHACARVVIVVMHSSVGDGEGENVSEDRGALTRAIRQSGTCFLYRGLPWTHAAMKAATTALVTVTVTVMVTDH